MLQPLRLVLDKVASSDSILKNVERNCARGLREFTPAFCAHDGHFVVVGSGPSLAGFAEEIREERRKGRPICAVKGAHDWLCDQGIKPDLFFSIDYRDRRNNVMRDSPGTVYLLSSRCSPLMFDHLKSKQIMVVHCASTKEEIEYFGNKNVFLLGGCSTSGLRAINLAYSIGFRNVILYGMDSCNAPDGVTKRIDGSLTGQTTDVVVGDRKFTCNLPMAKQAEDFQTIYSFLPGVHIESKGDGLITAIIEERKRKGYVT